MIPTHTYNSPATDSSAGKRFPELRGMVEPSFDTTGRKRNEWDGRETEIAHCGH